MRISNDGLLDGGYIGLVFVGAGFAAAVDSQLFQKAIAADPRSTSAGYLLGGLCWFTIPFVLATTYGLTAAATEHLPSFPTYPNRMNSYEISNGMAMPYAALASMIIQRSQLCLWLTSFSHGEWGCTSSSCYGFHGCDLSYVCFRIYRAMYLETNHRNRSSETVATTALLSYNVYKAYINPKATGSQILKFSKIVVPTFAVLSSAIAVGMNHGGFSVGFLITAIGILVDSAIVPMACTIMWKKQSTAAVIISPILSSVAGILAWILKARYEYGTISITTLQGNLPLVAGNMTSLCVPILLTPLITYIKPQNFDWEIFETIKRGDDEHIVVKEETTTTDEVESAVAHATAKAEHDNKILLQARDRSILASTVLTLILLILWPIPMYGTGYVFSRGFFKGWIVIAFFWAFFAMIVIILLPLWEGRQAFLTFWRVLTGSDDKVSPSSEVIVGTDVRQSKHSESSFGKNRDAKVS